MPTQSAPPLLVLRCFCSEAPAPGRRFVAYRHSCHGILQRAASIATSEDALSFKTDLETAGSRKTKLLNFAPVHGRFRHSRRILLAAEENAPAVLSSMDRVSSSIEVFVFGVLAAEFFCPVGSVAPVRVKQGFYSLPLATTSGEVRASGSGAERGESPDRKDGAGLPLTLTPLSLQILVDNSKTKTTPRRQTQDDKRTESGRNPRMNPATAFHAQVVRRDADSLSEAVSDLASWIEEIKTTTREGGPREGVRPSGISSSSAEASLNSGSCEELRRRGNEKFAEGRFDDAVRCYTRCLKNANENEELLPNALLLAYSNRGKKEGPFSVLGLTQPLPAMANLKLKRWNLAEADATSALEIDPSHSKSLQRRATARLSLGKLRAATVDVCSARDCASGSFVDGQGEPDERAPDNASERERQELERLSSRIDSALAKAIRDAPRRKIAVRTILS
ncbi:hypothetical protein THAOC_04752 [Thalassiosira oceanica]|uniref:Uncharacterized protein n=1 Tax=Thalassiosira oceanica TaxID=159749 RepID=K0T4E9_THAOC|nr:hypothetical protein THAOC_04752 [Thalassiosira oceanica]|eukprot:EJK73613.1 hypothetical protein THAOC_04752 [Thalassiosira oceanica]